MGSKKKHWSYSAGRRGSTVRVYERPGRGIWISSWDPTERGGEGGEIRKPLGHDDRQKAKDYADDQARKIRDGMRSFLSATPTVGLVIDLYLEEETPSKGRWQRLADRQQAALWKNYLERAGGEDFDLSRLSLREWGRFVRERATGEIDARGLPVAEEDDRRPVGDRTVEKNLKWLRTVCRWATGYRHNGELLLERDPTAERELEKRIPHERNPARPVATDRRLEAIRKKAPEVTMRVLRGGKTQERESYLPELLEIVAGTGRRISAVCRLRQEDLRLEPADTAPHGAIVWPADTDKMGKAWACPVSPRVRRALQRALVKREAVGPGPLFPAPGDPAKPLRYETASSWLRQAEEEAELPPQEGSLWHAYRRRWACVRKDLPDLDVAQAGGWSSLEALKSAYQQPDEATMLRVVTHEAELREVR